VRLTRVSVTSLASVWLTRQSIRSECDAVHYPYCPVFSYSPCVGLYTDVQFATLCWIESWCLLDSHITNASFCARPELYVCCRSTPLLLLLLHWRLPFPSWRLYTSLSVSLQLVVVVVVEFLPLLHVLTSSSVVTERPRDASCLSVSIVSFNQWHREDLTHGVSASSRNQEEITQIILNALNVRIRPKSAEQRAVMQE